jgi:excinuclease ABC subunit B
MREAAADLDFEEAARLRDEIKRLRQTELAVVDDPTTRNVMGTQDPKLRRATSPSPRLRGEGRGEGQGPHKPSLDEMGIALSHEVKPARSGSPRSKMGRPGMRGGFKKRGR